MPISSRLLSFARELQRATSFRELLDVARAETRAAVGYKRAWLYVADDADVREVKLIDYSGDERELTWEKARTLRVDGDPMLEEIRDSDSPVVVTDARVDPRTDKQIVAALDMRTIINVPMRLLDKPFGAFGCGSFGDEGCRPPTGEELDYLIGMAAQLSVAAGRLRFLEQRCATERERIRHHAIRSILDNITSGLFMCDRYGNVQGGYSKSCSRFFVAQGEFEGRALVELLGLDERSAGHFKSCYAQVINDLLPEELTLAQLPSRIRVKGRPIAISGSIVRAGNGSVQSVLFTLLDIGELIEAEREVERMRGVLQVMRHRSRFDEYIHELDGTLERLLAAPPSLSRELAARRELHTAKGAFAHFGLMDLVRAIHACEDEPTISAETLLSVRREIHTLLRENAPFWGISVEAAAARYMVTEPALTMIEARLARAASADDARDIVASAFAEIREKTVLELVGPLRESCTQHAARRGKCVRLEIGSPDLRCPKHFAPLFAVLPHLIRNAIDHGIEKPGERRDKSAEGTIRVDTRRSTRELTISVSDDGRGIDVDRVIGTAIQKGLVSAPDIARMTATERVELALLPGVSTSRELTDTSGRGVGMGAVKATAESFGGSMRIETSPGRGTSITLRVPSG